MEIAVISDLHLGPGGAADGFGHDDSDFIRFLAFLEANFERIVLLGDIWETLTGSLPGDPRAELLAARLAHPEIARRLSRPVYTYIHGNHDLVAGAALRARDLARRLDPSPRPRAALSAPELRRSVARRIVARQLAVRVPERMDGACDAA